MKNVAVSNITDYSVFSHRTDNEALSRLITVFHSEIIAHHKAVSRQVGCDIGMDWAACEWLDANCPRWRLLVWDRTEGESVPRSLSRLMSSVLPHRASGVSS